MKIQSAGFFIRKFFAQVSDGTKQLPFIHKFQDYPVNWYRVKI